MVDNASGCSADERHALLAEMIAAAHRAELVAVGPGRRLAFRLTRGLIAAALDNNVPADLIASWRHVQPGSVRTRASGGDGSITATGIEALSGRHPASLSRLSAIPLDPVPHGGRGDLYRMADLVRTVLAIPSQMTEAR
jgi:hypothetical protein